MSGPPGCLTPRPTRSRCSTRWPRAAWSRPARASRRSATRSGTWPTRCSGRPGTGTSASSGPARTPCSRTGRTRRTGSSRPTTSPSPTSGRSSTSSRPTWGAPTCSAATRSSTGWRPTCRSSSTPDGATSPITPTSPARSSTPRSPGWPAQAGWSFGNTALRSPGRRVPARGDRRRGHRVLHRRGQRHPHAPSRQGRAGLPLDPGDPSHRPRAPVRRLLRAASRPGLAARYFQWPRGSGPRLSTDLIANVDRASVTPGIASSSSSSSRS